MGGMGGADVLRSTALLADATQQLWPVRNYVRGAPIVEYAFVRFAA